MTIRLLTRQDGPVYQALRLRSLQEAPQAFLATYDSEVNLHERAFADHLDYSAHPPHLGYFGIFSENDQLLGYLQVSKTFLTKQNHMVFINNVYIDPMTRGQGLASKLFDHVLGLLRQEKSIERIYISCTASNRPALKLYQKLGFRRYGVQARAVKWHDKYDDILELVKVL